MSLSLTQIMFLKIHSHLLWFEYKLSPNAHGLRPWLPVDGMLRGGWNMRATML